MSTRKQGTPRFKGVSPDFLEKRHAEMQQLRQTKVTPSVRREIEALAAEAKRLAAQLDDMATEAVIPVPKSDLVHMRGKLEAIGKAAADGGFIF
jgi:hypothetical protein